MPGGSHGRSLGNGQIVGSNANTVRVRARGAVTMTRNKEKSPEQITIDLLKDLLIVQLGRAAVPQVEIRKIVGCDMGRVNRIVKQMKRER